MHNLKSKTFLLSNTAHMYSVTTTFSGLTMSCGPDPQVSLIRIVMGFLVVDFPFQLVPFFWRIQRC